MKTAVPGAGGSGRVTKSSEELQATQAALVCSVEDFRREMRRAVEDINKETRKHFEEIKELLYDMRGNRDLVEEDFPLGAIDPPGKDLKSNTNWVSLAKSFNKEVEEYNHKAGEERKAKELSDIYMTYASSYCRMLVGRLLFKAKGRLRYRAAMEKYPTEMSKVKHLIGKQYPLLRQAKKNWVMNRMLRNNLHNAMVRKPKIAEEELF